jgi:hypothetical protein
MASRRVRVINVLRDRFKYLAAATFEGAVPFMARYSHDTVSGCAIVIKETKDSPEVTYVISVAEKRL